MIACAEILCTRGDDNLPWCHRRRSRVVVGRSAVARAAATRERNIKERRTRNVHHFVYKFNDKNRWYAFNILYGNELHEILGFRCLKLAFFFLYESSCLLSSIRINIVRAYW